jgi:hypothetical protein
MPEGSEFEYLYINESSLFIILQTGTGVYPASYPMGTRGIFPGVKRKGRETDG